MTRDEGTEIPGLSGPGIAPEAEALIALRRLVPRARTGPVAASGLPGGIVSRRRGRGLEPVDIRPFVTGDDPRHIDRNATARSGTPQLRSFRDERERTVLLIADFRPEMLWGTRRALRSFAAAEALALVGWRVSAAGGRVGLLAFGSFPALFIPARGRIRGMAAVAGGLVAAHRAALAARGMTGPALDQLLDTATRLAPPGGEAILASGLDQPGGGFDAGVAALDSRARLSVLVISDAFETSPPPGTYAVADAAGRVRSLRAGPAGPTATSPGEGLRRAGIPVLRLSAADPPDRLAQALEVWDAPSRR